MDQISPYEQSVVRESKSSRKRIFLILSILFSLILIALIVFLSYIVTVIVYEKRNASKNTTYVQPSAQVDVRPDNRTHQELPVNQLEKKPKTTIENSDTENTEEETPNPEKLNKNEVLKTDEPEDLNTDDINKKEDEDEDEGVVDPPKPPVSSPVTDKVIEEEPKKTEDNVDVIVSPSGEEKKPDVVHPEDTPKKVKPGPKPVKRPQKVDDEIPETYDVPENAEELRKKYAERMEEQKRKVKEEKEFKEELDRLFKIRQEKAREDARRIKEKRGGKKKPEGGKDSDNVVPAGTDKDTIFKKLEQFAQKLKHTVIKGSFENCLIGKCEKLKSDFVYQWELELVSEVLSETETSINLEKEYKTVGEYREFTKRYGKYMSTKQMFKNSFDNYRKNIVKIEKHNKDPKRLYNMEVNALADMGSDSSQLSSLPVRAKERLSGASKIRRNLRNQEIDVDWRKKGVVSEIIHQGACGSCWAIAAVDVFNSHTAIKNRDKTKYSYQQLVDCVSPKYNCDRGGSQLKGLEYIRDNKMCKDEEYKYKAVKNQCSAYKCEKETGLKEIVNLKDKNAVEFLKKNGPFLTLFYTSNDFFLYGDGIFNGSCEAKEAHSVVVVGHGLDTEKNKKYWIVKNSWGEDWGEEGYFRILDEPTSDSGQKSQYCDFLKYSRGIV